MRQETSEAATAAKRMQELHTSFLTPGRRPDPTGVRASPAEAPAPLSLGVLDHITDAVAELTACVTAIAPTAGPAPAVPHEAYRWAIEATQHAAVYQQRARDALVYRQSLDHALLIDGDLAIRRHTCPRCATYSLFWRAGERRAMCTHSRCVSKDGTASRWTTAQIARHHIQVREEILARRAT